MMKEWFPRHQRSINWMRSPHGALRTARNMWVRVSEKESVKKRESGLSCWLVLPAARKRRECMCSLSCWLACPVANQREEKDKTGISCSKGLRGREWKNVTLPFYSCPGKWPGQNGMKYPHWSKIWVWDQNSQNIPVPDNNLKFFLLHYDKSIRNLIIFLTLHHKTSIYTQYEYRFNLRHKRMIYWDSFI